MGSKGTSTQNQQQFQNQTQNQQNASTTTQNQLVNQAQTGTQAQTQNQQGTSTYNPYAGIMSAGNQALQQAQQAASSPFQLPVAPVAGFSNDQQQAFQQYRDMQGAATPYFNQAQGLFNQSAAPISAGQISQYMNPYASSILANLHESQRQQMNDMTGRATQTAGGVGADRIGVAQGEMARQQALAEGQTLSGIYGNALSAAQQDAGRQQSAAYGIGNLGGAYQNSLMQGAGALGAAGAQQQQLQQAQLNAPYQNQLAQLALPYQQAQYLSGITGGLAGALGGTTTTNQTGNTLGQTTNNSQTIGQNTSNTLGQTYGQTSGNTLGYGQSTPAPPNMFSQLAGLGTAGAGLYGALNQNGFFGGGDPAYGSGNGEFGGSSNNPLPGLSALDYGAGYARGGYADGGGDVSGDESWMNADPVVPEIHAQPQQANHPDIAPLNMSPLSSSQAAPMPAMNFAQPETKSPDLKWLDMRPPDQKSSGSSDGGILGGLGSVLGAAAKIAPLFALAQGGAVGSTPYQHFDEGGDVSFDDRFNDSATMGQMPRSDALKYFMERQGRPSPPTSYIPPEEAPLPRERPAEASPRADIPGVYRMPSQEAVQEWRNGNNVANLPPTTRLNVSKVVDQAPEKSAPEPAGLGAISPAAAQVAAKNQQEMQRANYDVPYGDLNHTQDTSRNFAKSPWMALISAGAGMMASGSPYLGVGIGKGLQAGVENLNKQRESSREEETVNQRAKQLAIQADKHLREYTQLTPAETVTADIAKQKLDQEKWQVVYDPQSGKPYWTKQGEKSVPAIEGVSSPSGGATLPPGARPAQGVVTADASNTIPIPGSAPIKGFSYTPPSTDPSTSPGQVYNAKTGNLSSEHTQGTVKALERADKAGEAANDASMQLGHLEQALGAIDNASKQYGGALQTGAFATQRFALAKTINGMAATLGVPGIDPALVGAAEEAGKVTTRLGFALSRTLGAREAQQIVDQAIKANPGIENTPEGRKYIISTIRAGIDRQREYQQFVHDYRRQWRSAVGAEEQFNKQNPPEKYIARVGVETAPPEFRNPAALGNAIKHLRDKSDDPRVIAEFNRIYHGTAGYFLKNNPNE